LTAYAQGRGFRLAIDAQPVRGPAGERFGKGTGSSMEFQEFRDYQAGDDLRHVDWRAYARTETLTTRLYREEVAATVELIIDGSRSMGVLPDKRARCHELSCFLAGAASGDAGLRAFHAREALIPLEAASLQDPQPLTCDAETPLSEVPLGGSLRAGTIRIVLSDFLFPCDPRALVRRLHGRAHRLLLLQLLDPLELEPSARGNLRLQEVETGQDRELPVDDATVRRYRERLERHCRSLAEEAQRSGADFLQVSAGLSLDQIARQVLSPAAVVVPR